MEIYLTSSPGRKTIFLAFVFPYLNAIFLGVKSVLLNLSNIVFRDLFGIELELNLAKPRVTCKRRKEIIFWVSKSVRYFGDKRVTSYLSNTT